MIFSAIVCPVIPALTHGSVVLNGTTFRSLANVTCDPGYRLEDGETTTTISCQADATWSKQNMSCEGK